MNRAASFGTVFEFVSELLNPSAVAAYAAGTARVLSSIRERPGDFASDEGGPPTLRNRGDERLEPLGVPGNSEVANSD